MSYDEDCAIRPLDPAKDMQAPVAEAAQIPDFRLIMIDSVVSTVSRDGNSNIEVRQALQPLVHLAERVAAAAISLTHFTKGTVGREPLERITGSLAFGALARLVWCTVKINEKGETNRLVRVKSNIGPDGGGLNITFARPFSMRSRNFWRKQLSGVSNCSAAPKTLLPILKGANPAAGFRRWMPRKCGSRKYWGLASCA